MNAFLVIALTGAALAGSTIAAQASTVDVRSAERAARAPISELRLASVTRSAGIRFHRFRQVVDGVPVLDSEAVITDASGKRGDLVADSTVRVSPPSPALLSGRAAVAAALTGSGVRSLRFAPRASRAVLATPDRARMVWRVLIASAEPLASFEVVVDARSGEIVRLRDLLRRASGTAMLFDPNPVVTNGGTAGLSDSGDADGPALTNLRRQRTLSNLDASTCLRGPWVDARLQAGNPVASTPSGDVCAVGGNFDSVTRADDRFEALMAYFHIDRTHAYLQSLGLGNALNRQIRANVDAPISGPATEVGQDNSFFDPLTGELTFGTGFADDAEDGETIVHEYGHAIQDAQVPLFGSSDDAAAMGEGFGDYLASTMSARFAPSAAFDACFDEWDAFASGFGSCLRRVDWSLRPGQSSPDCPSVADEHCRGEVWSGALWAIRAALGGPAADRLVIQSQFSLTATASFDQASRALIAADAALYAGADRAVLESVLGSRGLVNVERLDDTPADARVLTLPGSVSGRLSAGDDTHDVYRVSLGDGRPIVIRLLSSSGDYDLRLLPPGATTVDGSPVAYAETAGANETIRYTPGLTGAYYVDVRDVSGTGPYVLKVASDDADRDGVADGRDVCPAKPNRDQADWDEDGHGDVCDRSARVSITGVRRTPTGLRVDARMLPTALPARALRLTVWKRSCAARRCHERRVRTLRASRSRRGRVVLRVHIGTGRYRLRAALTARGYRAARSASKVVQVKHRARARPAGA